jgi:hypothetical protein
MKNKFKIAMLSTAFAITATSLQASDDFSDGDLAVVFYSATGSGSSTVIAQNYYVYNLGPANLYRENTQNNVSVGTINTSLSGNINADLTSTFGDGWAENTNLRWFVVGKVGQISALTNGDPAKTTYLSVRRASLDNGAAGTDPATPNFPTSISSSNRTGLTNAIDTFLRVATNNGIAAAGATTGSYTSTPGANPSGVILPTTNLQSLKAHVPNSVGGTLFFTLSHDPSQKFTAGSLSGSAAVQGALDIFRTLNDTTVVGADLTAGASSGNAADGIGQFIGALTIDSSGNLKIQGVSSANFAAWATTNGATGQTAGMDHDSDGVSNGVEYFIGGSTGNTTGFTAVPGATTVSGYNGVTWTKAAGYTGVYGTDFAVETSTSLADGSWTTETAGVNVTISGNDVRYNFPTGPEKKFARLKVTGP